MESFSLLLLSFAQREDSIFYFVLFLSAVAFLLAEAFWLVRRLKSPARTNLLKKLPPDDARFEVMWTIVPALVLVLLAFVHSGGRISKQRTASYKDRSVKAQERLVEAAHDAVKAGAAPKAVLEAVSESVSESYVR